MSDEEKRKGEEWWDQYDAATPGFMGNVGEPDTVTSYT